jgi:hypothetical protein
MLSTASVSSVPHEAPRNVTSAVWLPRPSTGGRTVLFVGAAVGVLALAAAIVAASWEPSPAMLAWAVLAVVLGALAAGLSLWGLAYRQLAYTLRQQTLEVLWLGIAHQVPYEAIDGVYSGQRLVGNATPSVPAWPGIYVGPGRARGIGRLHFFATSPDPAALTLITLHHGGVVVSARNPHDFRLALIDRLRVTPDEAASWSHQPVARAPWSAIFDRWFMASLSAAIVLLLVILLLIAMGFDALPAEIAMRFDATGQPTQISPRGDLLRLPLIGLLVLVANTALGIWLHPRERLLARLLCVAAAVVEGLTLVALVRLLQ